MNVTCRNKIKIFLDWSQYCKHNMYLRHFVNTETIIFKPHKNIVYIFLKEGNTTIITWYIDISV